MVWIVCVDLFVVVRECSDMDCVYYNFLSLEKKDEDVVVLVVVGFIFVEGFNDSIF